MNRDTKSKIMDLLWNDDVSDKEFHMLSKTLSKIIPEKIPSLSTSRNSK